MSRQVKKAGFVLIIGLACLVLWLQTRISPQVSAAPPAAAKSSAELLPLGSAPAPTPIARLFSVEAPALLGSPAARPLPLGVPAAKPPPFFLLHPVQAGETLVAVAARYNLTTEKLLAANEIRDPTQLAPGQELLIPPADQFYQGRLVPHRLKAGETILSLAVKYGSSVKAIEVANAHLELGSLAPGETLAVPVIFSRANPPVFVEAPAGAVYHRVQPGENPAAIAAAYDLPLEILLAANRIADPRRLQIGRKLMIPPHPGINQGFPVILYELAAGDTLMRLASRFGSSVKDILAVNPELDPAALTAGQQVAIPVIFAPPRHPARPFGPLPPSVPPPALPDLQQQLAAAVNDERQQHGLAPYLYDEQLESVALAHAQDMVVRDFLAHVTPDGKRLADRLAAGGIEGVKSSGENIQRNARPQRQAATAAVAWFMNSAPHRYNLLHEQYTHLGVAAVEGAPGWYTFVLVFAQRPAER